MSDTGVSFPVLLPTSEILINFEFMKVILKNWLPWPVLEVIGNKFHQEQLICCSDFKKCFIL